MRSHINHQIHLYNITHHQPLGYLSPQLTPYMPRIQTASHRGRHVRVPTLTDRAQAGHVNICVIQLIMINALAESHLHVYFWYIHQ